MSRSSFVGYRARFGGATVFVAGIAARDPIARCRCTSNCARRARAMPAAQAARFSSRQRARLPPIRHAISCLFAQGHDLAGATIAIDSDGGSVLGAIALGREIRKLKLVTTVGRLVDTSGGWCRAISVRAFA